MEKNPAWKIKWIYISIGIFAFLAIAGYLLWQARAPFSDVRDIEIIPMLEDAEHITLSGEFRVTGAGGIDIDRLASMLVIEPWLEFSLTPDSEGEIIMQTFRPLTAGRTIRIALRDESGKEQRDWQFKTATMFSVVEVFPANHAVGVGINSSVEITFSHEDFNPEEAEKYITISPEIESRHFFSRFGTLVMVNYSEFAPNTAYKVTVSSDFPLSDGTTLGEDYVFSFTTGGYVSYEYAFHSNGKFTENFLPDEPGVINLYMGEAIQAQGISTTIYQFPGGKEYLDVLRRYRDAQIKSGYNDHRVPVYGVDVDTSGLQEVMRFDSHPIFKRYAKCVIVPDNLPEGWYVAELETVSPEGERKSFHKIIQVSGLAIYYAQSRDIGKDAPNQLIAWVNDTATGNPVEGAGISVTSSNYNVSGRTGTDGLAILEGYVTPVDRYGEPWRDEYPDVYGILAVLYDGKPFYDLFGEGYSGSYGYNPGRPQDSYYAYLFTDRPVYKPTDTVKVWGLVKPRQNSMPLPEGIGLSGLDGTEDVMPVTLNPDGTFVAEISLENRRTGMYWLNLRDEHNEYTSLWLEIRSYVKPVYETAAQPDKPVFTGWGDEGAWFSFHAAYYEGTPAQNYNAVMRTADDYSSMPFPAAVFSTNAKGGARIAVHPNRESIDKWQPQQVPYGIYSLDALDSPQIHGGTFGYLYRDTMLRAEAAGGNTPSVTVYTNKIDVSRIRTEADLLVHENLMGGAVDTDITVDIHRIYYIKTPNGERYDAVNKTSVTAYDYEYKNEVVDTLQIRTQNGRYELNGLPQNDKESTYYLTLTAMDTRGLPVIEEVYYGLELRQTDWESPTDFKLMKREAAAAEPTYNTRYSLWDESYFGDGEETGFVLVNDMMEPVNNPGGRMLYCVFQQRILDHGLVNGTELSLPFDEAYLPNYVLSGAYFDGRHIYAMRYTEMLFSPEKRDLSIDIKTGREHYNPGQSADITLRVTEKEGGKAVTDATVVAAVVDEAVFAIREQEPEFLSRLYRRIHINNIIQYTSYDNHSTDGGGKGGGGPDPFAPRTDFQDTAAFTVLTTDQNGEASLGVPLPDNLTSWRVTALALSDEMKAGNTKSRFAVSQDFFIVPVIPQRILEGDDLVVTVRGAGRLTGPEDFVEYTCRVDGIGEALSFQGKAGEFSAAHMGQLPLGDYTLTIGGKNGDYSDAVRVPLQVVESGIDAAVIRSIEPRDVASLRSTTYPVELGFYSKEHALHTDIMRYLTGCQGIRTDQRVAQRYAQERLLAEGMDINRLDGAVLSDTFLNALDDRPLYRLFPYSEGSLSLSARMESAVPDYYQGTVLSIEELDVIADSTQRAAGYLLYAKYMQDKNTQAQIIQQLESGGYDLQGKLYLVAALSRAGDSESAQRWYAELLAASAVREQKDADGHRMSAILQGGKVNEADTVTAYLAASYLENRDDAEAFARYLLFNPPTGDLAVLEHIFFMQRFPVESGNGSEISYMQNGVKQRITLTAATQHRSFSRAELERLDLQAISGDVGVTAYYTAAYAEANRRENRGLLLTKTIEPADGGTLRKGELAKIILQLTVPDGLSLPKDTVLRIDDYVPTGMRYEYMHPGSWHLTAHNGQRVSFSVSLEYNSALTFYARCVAPGQYVGESAFAGVGAGSVWGESGRFMVVIEPD